MGQSRLVDRQRSIGFFFNFKRVFHSGGWMPFFYFMANILELVQFESEEEDRFELLVCKDGSVNISELNGSTYCGGTTITITPEDWEIIVNFVKAQQEKI